MTALDELKRVEHARVWKGEVEAAVLERTATGVRFRYLDGYDGPAVATTLPREQDEVTLGGAVPPFFAGLLPEGRRLTALRTAAKTSADDELTLLLAVGHDPVGDVRVLPPDGSVPPEDAPHADPLDFEALFARVTNRDPADRVGLPGVQDKVSGRMIALPVQWRGTPAILKLEPPEFPGVVENEAFFYRAARASGLATAEVEVLRDADGRPGLLVQRFDRESSKRLPQEDGCQVAGRYPADKYRLSTEQVFAALCDVTDAPLVAARDLIRQLAFAYLSCNGDAHAKNFSVLQRGGEWRVSPAYDLPCTQVYGDFTMALSVDGRDREDIGRKHFVALGAALGVPAKAVVRVVDAVLAAVPTWEARLDELPFDQRRVHKLRRAVRWRCERLAG